MSGGERSAGPPEGALAVVAALRQELRPFLDRLGEVARLDLPGGRFYAARLGGRPLVVGWTGDGAAAAERGLGSLLARRAELAGVVLAGVAGGLSPGLAPASVVVARAVRDAAGTAPAPDERWGRWALARGGDLPGVVFSAERIVATREAKAALWAEVAGAAGGVAVVDLETACQARLAGAAGIPYLALRAVSDAAEESLPVDFERFRVGGGGVRRHRVVGHALGRPALVAELWALRRRLQACARRLADLLTAALDG